MIRGTYRSAGILTVIIAIMALMFAAMSQAATTHKATAASHPKVKITAKQADEIALKKIPGGKIVGKTKLENEEGKLQYGVMIQSGKELREVMVDAMTGKIVSVEKTNPAKERAEEKAEASKGQHVKPAATTKPRK